MDSPDEPENETVAETEEKKGDLPEGVVPYITLDELPSESALGKGVLAGTVASNYPVRYVHIELYDKDGKLVSREIQRNNYDVMKVGLKKYSINLFDGVAAGEYTLRIEAGICRGETELAKIDFTYNG